MKNVSKMMNVVFRYEIFVSHGNKYGRKQEDGSWDGMIGYLLNEVNRANTAYCSYVLSIISWLFHLKTCILADSRHGSGPSYNQSGKGTSR